MNKTEVTELLDEVRADIASGVERGRTAAQRAARKVALASLETVLASALPYPEVDRPQVVEQWAGDRKLGESVVQVRTLDVPADLGALVHEARQAIENGSGWHHPGFPAPPVSE